MHERRNQADNADIIVKGCIIIMNYDAPFLYK